MPARVRHLRWLPLVAACTVALPAVAQQRVVTAADYARSERAMTNAAVTALAAAGQVAPNWFANDRFWYRTSEGQFLLVDPVRKSRVPAFDHARVATALAKASGTVVNAQHLPFTTIAFTKDFRDVMFTDAGKDWSCDVKGSRCTALAAGAMAGMAAPVESGGGGRGGRGGGRGGGFGRGGAGAGARSSDDKPLTMSPDGSRGVFIRDWNLWVKETASGQETQLTTDGVKDFGYSTNNAGWTGGDNAVGLWSPDSRKFATQQQDERGVGHMYLVTTPTGHETGRGGEQIFSDRVGGHPILKDWAYPLPGDSIITTIQRVIIDVPARKVIRLKMPPDQHRGTVVDNLNMADLKWRPDGSELVFVSSSRDHKHAWVRSADAATGAVREVFEETSPTQFESGPGQTPLWTVLSAEQRGALVVGT